MTPTLVRSDAHPMFSVAAPLAALLLLGIAGCNQTPYGGRGSDDGAIIGKNGVACCPMDADPSCDCTAIGGSPSARGSCGGVCDRASNWSRSVDDNGCPMWVPEGGACGVPDSGPDSELPPPPRDCSTATFDVADQGIAQGICDQQDGCTVCVQNVDVVGKPLSYTVFESDGCSCPEPQKTVACCPISSPSCDCTYLGGSQDPTSGECGGCYFDGPPPSFRLTSDENGCPTLELVATTDSCFPPGWGQSCEGESTSFPTREEAEGQCSDPYACTVCPETADADGNTCSWAVYATACDSCPPTEASATACPPAP